MPEKKYVKSFSYDSDSKIVGEQPVSSSQFTGPDYMPGGALSISANGIEDGIVWVSMPNSEPRGTTNSDSAWGLHRGYLDALNATNLSDELWRDECIIYFAKFNPPMIADGRVYLATFADPTSDDPTRAAVPGKESDCKKSDPEWVNVDTKD